MRPSRGDHFYKLGTSLQELIQSDQADRNILYLPKDYSGRDNNYESVDISKDSFGVIIPDASFFWMYIYDDGNTQKNAKHLFFRLSLAEVGIRLPRINIFSLKWW